MVDQTFGIKMLKEIHNDVIFVFIEIPLYKLGK